MSCRHRKLPLLLCTCLCVSSLCTVASAAHSHDHDHGHGNSTSCCAVADTMNFAIDCHDQQIQLSAWSNLTSSCTPSTCEADAACTRWYYIIQAHHDHCLHDQVRVRRCRRGLPVHGARNGSPFPRGFPFYSSGFSCNGPHCVWEARFGEAGSPRCPLAAQFRALCPAAAAAAARPGTHHQPTSCPAVVHAVLFLPQNFCTACV